MSLIWLIFWDVNSTTCVMGGVVVAFHGMSDRKSASPPPPSPSRSPPHLHPPPASPCGFPSPACPEVGGTATRPNKYPLWNV